MREIYSIRGAGITNLKSFVEIVQDFALAEVMNLEGVEFSRSDDEFSITLPTGVFLEQAAQDVLETALATTTPKLRKQLVEDLPVEESAFLEA